MPCWVAMSGLQWQMIWLFLMSIEQHVLTAQPSRFTLGTVDGTCGISSHLTHTYT